MLGGGQGGAFSVELLNVGAAPVDVVEVTRSGDTTVVSRLGPDASTQARFAAGSAALLRNHSGRDATVRAVVRGDTDLGMRYVPVDGGPE